MIVGTGLSYRKEEMEGRYSIRLCRQCRVFLVCVYLVLVMMMMMMVMRAKAIEFNEDIFLVQFRVRTARYDVSSKSG